MSSAPIGGNSGFRSVEYVAGQVKNLDVANSKFSQINAQNVSLLGNMSDKLAFAGKGVLNRVVAYTPTEFAGLADQGVVTLLNAPNLTQALAANDTRIVKIPVGAEVISVRLLNLTLDVNGTAFDNLTGATDFDVGMAAFNTANGSLLNACPVATVNATLGGYAQAALSAATQLGGTGTLQTGITASATLDNNCLNLQNTNGGGGAPVGPANRASAAVVVEYILRDGVTF